MVVDEATSPFIFFGAYHASGLVASSTTLLILFDLADLDVLPAYGKRFGSFANTVDLETKSALFEVCSRVFAVRDLGAVDPYLDVLTLGENSVAVPAFFLVDLVG